MPTWERENYSSTAPTTPNAQRCIERWGLLPPYDMSITEEQWKEYFDERSAVEDAHNPDSAEYNRVTSEELMQNTERLLTDARGRLENVILGSCLEDEERKTKIAEILKRSLYYLSLWGNEEDGMNDSEDRKRFSPRTVKSETRLYSPFGIGTSVDFKYHYHNRWGRADEQFAAMVMHSREVLLCDASNPFECTAEMTGRGMIGPPAEECVRLFNWAGGKKSGTTAANIAEYEDTLLASNGWLSPRLIFNILQIGGTATIYQDKYHFVDSARDKFKLFVGETEELMVDED